MPVRFQKKCESGAHLLVWEANESENEMLAILPSSVLTEIELEEIKRAPKKKEFLASRLAIKYLANHLNIPFSGIKKDQYGKPHLVDSFWQMSITHSKDFMAVIMHPNNLVGIDIEKPQEKMWKIMPRLYTEREISDIDQDLENMSIYWSAKEALYKLYGKRGTNFRENLKIHKTPSGLLGEIIMPDYQKSHVINYTKLGKYILVWVV
ncbi:MAG: 4'-phosphopantetheinyl transferase [Algoriphagus sp.]|jgi:4'-phosphopantetheinyl transferase